MIKLLKSEIYKIFKLVPLQVTFFITFLFGFLSLLFRIGENISAYYIPISSLSNLTQTMIIVLLVCMSGYIYGIELETKALKIIRAKPVQGSKVMAVKFMTAILYVSALLLLTGLMIFLLSVLIFPLSDFPLKAGSEERLPASSGIVTLLLAYSIEIIPLAFVAFLAITFSLLFNSHIIGGIAAFFFFLLCRLVQALKSIAFYLPSTHILLWEKTARPGKKWDEIVYACLLLALYSLALYGITVVMYNKKQVTV